ncbi:hypothetical protein [Kitasatospora mediocidica]|uniref:hypothetical protein n=1 Tax=Kitasatospora mediocidica TaxID=58352 RepID=UPI00056C0D42|nr:hypothetical protein [Kitasatospora mediocidica]
MTAVRVLLALVGPIALLLPVAAPLRILLVLAALLTVPGVELVRRLAPEQGPGGRDRSGGRLRAVVLTVAVSLGFAAVTGTALMLAGAFTPVRVLLTAALAAVLLALLPGRRAAP